LVLSFQLKELVAQLQHEVQRIESNAPQDLFHPTSKESEMKIQIQDEGLDSNREGEQLFHSLTSLTEE
jgi:hypothetical protein